MRILKLSILIWILIDIVQNQYQIPSYYGFWSKRFYQPKYILQGHLTVFQMHFGIDMDYNQTTVHFADKIQHCILTSDRDGKGYKILAGKCSRSGDRVGNTQSSYFNGPSSIAYYRPDPDRIKNASNTKAYITKNDSCSINDQDCIIDDIQLQTLQTPLTLNNIRLYPFYDLFSMNPNNPDQYLFITDRLNHCIKKISINIRYTQVIAGFCGQAGFLDGPLGFNRLNKPSNIGVDGKGVVFFFDQGIFSLIQKGNEYMRKINIDKSVQTLLNGACTQYKRSNETNRKIKNFEIKKMICYQNWIQKKTASPIQHYFNQDLLNICTLHSSKCPSQF